MVTHRYSFNYSWKRHEKSVALHTKNAANQKEEKKLKKFSAVDKSFIAWPKKFKSDGEFFIGRCYRKSQFGDIYDLRSHYGG